MNRTRLAYAARRSSQPQSTLLLITQFVRAAKLCFGNVIYVDFDHIGEAFPAPPNQSRTVSTVSTFDAEWDLIRHGSAVFRDTDCDAETLKRELRTLEKESVLKVDVDIETLSLRVSMSGDIQLLVGPWNVEDSVDEDPTMDVWYVRLHNNYFAVCRDGELRVQSHKPKEKRTLSC